MMDDHLQDERLLPDEDIHAETSDNLGGSRNKSNQRQRIDHGSGENDASVNVRWRRLKTSYNEQYSKLFRDTHFEQSPEIDLYTTTQYGAVIWTADEKVRFFNALDRYGIHGTEQLAQSVGSKSPIEIQAYISLLQQGEAERQMFLRQAKNVSKAEIPAAIEVDVEYEQGLEKFADALAAYQDRYDYIMGWKKNTDDLPWLITAAAADSIDREVDEDESNDVSSNASSVGANQESASPQTLFRLSNFLELSTKLFMNGSHRKQYEHWSYCAEDGETPSVTSEAFEEFYDITLNFLRRVLQTTMFLAQSRIRSTANKHKRNNEEVRLEDVEAMCQVLGIDNDLWSYWTRLPRRAGFRVVAGNHCRGSSDRVSLRYEDVEAALAVRHHQGRRRSLSVTSNSCRSNLSGSGESEISETSSRMSREGFAEYDETPPTHVSLQALADDPAGPYIRQIMSTSETEAEEENDSSGDTDNTDDIDDAELDLDDANHVGGQRDYAVERDQIERDEGDSETTPPPASMMSRMSSRKRRRIEEEGLEIYLQDLDVYTRVSDEHWLTDLLGIGTPSGPLENFEDIGRRPKVPRKAPEVEQTVPLEWPQACWEAHGVIEVPSSVTDQLPQTHDNIHHSVEDPD